AASAAWPKPATSKSRTGGNLMVTSFANLPPSLNDMKISAFGPHGRMSALGQTRTFRSAIGMSALPPKADMRSQLLNVRQGPEADIQLTAHLKATAHLERPF